MDDRLASGPLWIAVCRPLCYDPRHEEEEEQGAHDEPSDGANDGAQLRHRPGCGRACRGQGWIYSIRGNSASPDAVGKGHHRGSRGLLTPFRRPAGGIKPEGFSTDFPLGRQGGQFRRGRRRSSSFAVLPASINCRTHVATTSDESLVRRQHPESAICLVCPSSYNSDLIPLTVPVHRHFPTVISSLGARPKHHPRSNKIHLHAPGLPIAVLGDDDLGT